MRMAQFSITKLSPSNNSTLSSILFSFSRAIALGQILFFSALGVTDTPRQDDEGLAYYIGHSHPSLMLSISFHLWSDSV